MKPGARNRPEKILKDTLKTTRENKSNPAVITASLYIAKVVDNNDPEQLNRIKVNIPGIDKDRPTPWCRPAMPSFFHIVPKPDELVFIILQNPWDKSQGRYYVGPIYSEELAETYAKAASGYKYIIEE